MAVGLALMVGLYLPWNFNTPYAATSFIDFWRRWHITLSGFFRDYLYIPLGGNRGGTVRQSANLMITMTLAGLWHGAAWTFVLWGAIHGMLLILAHRFKRDLLGLPVWVSITLLNLILIFTWIFFQAETFRGARQMLSSFVRPPSPAGAAERAVDFAAYFFVPPTYALSAACLAIALGYTAAVGLNTREMADRFVSAHSLTKAVMSIAAAGAMSTGLFLASGASVEFIYFDF